MTVLVASPVVRTSVVVLAIAVYVVVLSPVASAATGIDQTQVSKIVSPVAVQPMNIVKENSNRFLRGMGATTGDIADEERAGLQLRNWAQQGKTADDVYKDLGLHQIMGTFSKVEEFMKHPAYQKYNKYRDFLDKNDFRIWARQGKSPMDVFDKLGLHQILGTYKSYDDFMKHPTYKKFDNYRSFLWKFDYEKWAKQGKTADNVYDDLKIQVHGPKSKMFYDQYPDYRKYEGYRMYLKKSEEKAKEV